MCTIETAAVIELNIPPHTLKSFDIVHGRRSRIDSLITCSLRPWIDQMIPIFVEPYSTSFERYQILFIIILFNSHITNKCNILRILFQCVQSIIASIHLLALLCLNFDSQFVRSKDRSVQEGPRFSRISRTLVWSMVRY